MRRTLSVTGMLLLAMGCQTPNAARYVSRMPDAGVVAVPNDTSGGRNQALDLITDHVGPSFVIDKEEDISTEDRSARIRDRDRSVRSSSDPLNQKNPQDTYASVPRPASEHRIHYHRAPASTTESLSTNAKSQPTLPGSGVVPASATVPAAAPTSAREGAAAPGGVRSFMPLTCEGCQGR